MTHLRGPGGAVPGILREVWKGYWNWNYTLQNKGRDLLSFLQGTGPEGLAKLCEALISLLVGLYDPLWVAIAIRGTYGQAIGKI